MKILAQLYIKPENGPNVEIPFPENFRFKYTNISGVLDNILNYVLVIAGIGLLIMLIAGGFSFLTSAGDTKKLESAKNTLLNAFVGFLIVFASFWIVQIAGYVLGFPAITKIFGQ